MTILGPQRITVGPELYYSVRKRSGGTEQEGDMWGGFLRYDRLKHRALYWGVEGYWAKGCLKGKSALGTTILSVMTDSEIEGKLGWTLCYPLFSRRIVISPYCGYGYYYGKNHYRKPEEMPLTFYDRVEYFTTGFLAKYHLNPCWSVGLQFAGKWMFEGKNKVTGDPDGEEDFTIVMGNRTFYAAEIPITYKFLCCSRLVEAYVAPFIRTRRYGYRENFPIDFIDTRFRIYGLRFSFFLNF
ncbi:MAG: hypothetical protein Tsb0021_03480 [Chlamydiales bacterium]